MIPGPIKKMQIISQKSFPKISRYLPGCFIESMIKIAN